MRRIKRPVFEILLLCVLAGLLLSGAQALAEEQARNITQKAKITVSAYKKNKGWLTDGNVRECWDDAGWGYVEYELPEEEPCRGLYIQWDTLVPYAIQVPDENGDWKDTLEHTALYYNEFVPLEGLTHFRIASRTESRKKRMGIRETVLFSDGELPDWVQRWEPFEGKADLLILSTHPDDELIFFGGTIPYYAIYQGKKVQVAYIASVGARRRIELLDGLWSMGIRTYPQMPTSGFKDVFSGTVSGMYKTWRQENLEDYITWLVRKLRPEVIVTHDLNGEYGHGAHKCVASVACRVAEKLGAKENYKGGRSRELEPWQVKKLYIHLYKENRITMPWNEPLDCFDGRSPLDLAAEAFTYHISQQGGPHTVTNTDHGAYDSKIFGLYFTSVGPDSGVCDFLEHTDAETVVSEDD